MSKNFRKISAKYIVYSDWCIPKSIPLLPESENENNKPWSWWIKYDTLHYLDDKLEEHTLEPDCAASRGDFDYKRPDEEEDTTDDCQYVECYKCGECIEEEDWLKKDNENICKKCVEKEKEKTKKVISVKIKKEE